VKQVIKTKKNTNLTYIGSYVVFCTEMI